MQFLVTISIPLLDLPFIAKLDSKDAMIWNDSVQDSGANPSAAAEGFVLIPDRKKVYPPHIRYVTKEEYKILISKIIDQIAAHAEGNPINVVNAEVL